MVIMHHLKMPALGCWAKRAFSADTWLKPTPFVNLPQRFKATQIDCKHLEPKCGDRFKQGPCIKEQVNIKLKQPAPPALPPQERGIRLKRSHACCGSPCPETLPRFDLLYYKRTNKFENNYQQTWDECPDIVKKPKKVCCLDKIKPAKYKKRPRQARPDTACHQTCAATQAKCPYVTLRGCRLARHPPKCKHTTPEANCQKRQAPYLAFSEGLHKLPAIRPVECRCLLTPSICEVWAHHRYLARLKKIRMC